VRGGPARPESPDRYAELNKLLSTSPRAGKDLVIVSHGNPFVAVAGIPYLAEGEAAAIRPLDQQGFSDRGENTEGWLDGAARAQGRSCRPFLPPRGSGSAPRDQPRPILHIRAN